MEARIDGACYHGEARIGDGVVHGHDCDYVARREALVERAELRANARHGRQPVGEAGDPAVVAFREAWNRTFHAEMERLWVREMA